MLLDEILFAGIRIIFDLFGNFDIVVYNRRGDYEAALVLYNKAASICPRDSSHSVAARRTTAAISSAANPSSVLRKLLPMARNGAEMSATLCPEAAAIRAENILKQSVQPSAMIPQILEYVNYRLFGKNGHILLFQLLIWKLIFFIFFGEWELGKERIN